MLKRVQLDQKVVPCFEGVDAHFLPQIDSSFNLFPNLSDQRVKKAIVPTIAAATPAKPIPTIVSPGPVGGSVGRGVGVTTMGVGVAVGPGVGVAVGPGVGVGVGVGVSVTPGVGVGVTVGVGVGVVVQLTPE